MSIPQDLTIVEHKGNRILTSSQTAEFLGTNAGLISDNFNRNKDRYTEGKHYFFLEGKELKDFLVLHSAICGSQNLSKIRSLYLWTEKGVLMHVKSVNTDIAWQAHENLVDVYFHKIEQTYKEPVYFNKQTQDRCKANSLIMLKGHWCVENEMVSQALVLSSLQKELKHWCLPSGSGGKKFIQHLRAVKHPLLDEDRKYKLWVPNLAYKVDILVYPYELLEYFREWLRVEYAEYYVTSYLPLRIANTDQKRIAG